MDDRIPAVGVGVLFSIINAVVTVYLAMKTGMADGIILLLLFLSFFVFVAAKTVKSRAFVYTMAIMTSSTAAVIAYTDGLGAIILSRQPLPVPDPVLMALLCVSGVIGMLMSFYFAGYFLKGSFPWPQSKVTASIVTMLSSAKKDAQFKASNLRMTVAGILAGAVSAAKGLGVVPETIGLYTAGIGVSPMMIGLGMLIGIRACLQIALGAVASLAVLLFLEGPGTDYTVHMRSPWIFSTAVSMLVTTALISLYVIAKPAIGTFLSRVRRPAPETGAAARDGGRGFRRQLSGTTMLLVALIIVAAIALQYFIGIPAWIFLLCLPIAVIFQVIEARGKAEVSMSVGVSSFVIILLVGLAFTDIVPLLILEGFVVALILSFTLTLSMFKTAEYSGVSQKGLALMIVIGSLTGSVICIPIIRFLNSVYGIGTAALPAPYSVMWLEMASSAVTRVASPSINLYLILVGILVAIVLYRYKISAVAVAMGLILPVSINAALLVGGLIAWYVGKKGWLKDDNGMVASGLIAGDILVGLAVSLRSLF